MIHSICHIAEKPQVAELLGLWKDMVSWYYFNDVGTENIVKVTYGLRDILTALPEWAQETTRESGERLREVILR